MEWTFPASGALSADLDLAAGSVEIDLNATDEVKVRLEALDGSSQSARDQIEHAEVTFDGSRLDVRVPRRKHRDASLWLSVSVPARSSARVRTASADIACTGTLGSFECKTASGDVVLRGDCDAAHVATASGDVRMARVLGELQLQSASGDVSVTSIGGRASVTTASGDTRLGSVAHDARIRTASGDVIIGCASDGELSINTASGDVRVGVAPGVGAWLDLVTMSGDSTCSLPAEGQGETAATLRISCRTLSGDIDVHSGSAPSEGGTAGGSGWPGAEGGSGWPSAAGGTDMAGAGDPTGAIGTLPDVPDFADSPGPPPGLAGLAGIAAGLDRLAGLAGLTDLGDLTKIGRELRLPWRKA